MDERNEHLLCDAIVSADGPLKSFPPPGLQFVLFSCASAGMHLSFLASLVRFHSRLSSRPPIVVRRTSGFFVKLNWLSHPFHFFPTHTFLLIQASWKGSGLPPTSHDPPLSHATHGHLFNSLTQVATQTRGQTLHPQRPQKRSLNTPQAVCLLPLGGLSLTRAWSGTLTQALWTILDMHLLHHSLTTFFPNPQHFNPIPFFYRCVWPLLQDGWAFQHGCHSWFWHFQAI